ncbi:MAG TPA: lysophospholipid acyltransferase family protein [Chthoniobacteraceae bacterium]|nr:lysophospholipid acyltransferase family protein [Chthoniobacteraceae bacterium]
MSPNPCYNLGTFRTAYYLANILPRPIAQVLAGWIGRMSYAMKKKSREAQRENLRLVSGKEGSALDHLCQQNFENFVKMLADYFYCTCGDGSRAQRLQEERSGDDLIKAAFERGKGVIFVTAHIGNWELGGILLALMKVPLTVVSLEEPTTELTRWRDSYRRRLGIKTIMVGSSDQFSFVEMIRTLRNNEGVAMLVDRPYAGSGTPVQFFGKETCFSTAPALLWQHTDATVLPAFVLQNKKGRYLAFAEKAIPMRRYDDQREGLAANTQLVATAFEAIIREHPEQWFNYVPIWKKTEN